MSKWIHCPRKLAASMRMGTTHVVSILTHGSNTTPITSMTEGMPADISNIACTTSMSRHTPVAIPLITSMIEGLTRGSKIAHPLAFDASPQADIETLPLSTELSLKISTVTTAHQMDLPWTTQPVIIRQTAQCNNAISPGKTNLLADAISHRHFRLSFSCSTGTATAHPDPWHARHPLTQHLQHLLHLSVARSTRQSYHTGIMHCICFYRTQHIRLLPATSCTAAYFATALLSLEWPQQPYAYTCLLLVHVTRRKGSQTPAKTIHCSHW